MTDDVWISGDKSMFEAGNRHGAVEFERFSDGSFYIGIDGDQKEIFRMTPEQFAAFKTWIMEN
jgi:hypothetical protein